MDEERIIGIALEYFGQDKPAVYGINYRGMSADEYRRSQNAVYAISVNHINQAPWAKTIKPTAKTGYSTFILSRPKNRWPRPTDNKGGRSSIPLFSFCKPRASARLSFIL